MKNILCFITVYDNAAPSIGVYVVFGTKTKKCSSEIPDFTHYSPAGITSVALKVNLLFNFVQSILGRILSLHGKTSKCLDSKSSRKRQKKLIKSKFITCNF